MGKISSFVKAFDTPFDRVGRPDYRRLAVPYSFKPELSFSEAIIAALTAFLRIFLGSILFGFYGWYSLVALRRMADPLVRTAAALALVGGFLLLFALLMAAISVCARKLAPKKSSDKTRLA